MKILHVAECAGGVDIYLKSLLPRLTRKGYHQAFVCSDNFVPDDYFGNVDEVFPINMAHSMSPMKLLHSVMGIRRAIKNYKPDIVYCHSSFAGVYGRLAAICTNSTVVYNPHGWSFDMRCGKLKKFVFREIESALALITDKIVNISASEKKSAIKNKIPGASKIEVIYNGIDFESPKNGFIRREDLNIPSDAYVIGMVGRIAPQKAPDTFLKVGAKLRKHISNLWLIIVGDGDDKDKLIELAKNLGVADILTITGWVDNAPAYLKVFDQATLFSRWEGFGLVLPEYARAHLPIVATKVGAIGEVIVDNKSGLLIESDDIDAAVSKILDIYHNPLLKKSLVEFGYEYSYKCFNIERVVNDHIALFKSLKKSAENE